jgi:phosphoribosylformylglycinamidine synthase
MKCAVITFPGSNCDYDLYKAVQLVGGEAEFLWHRETDLGQVDVVLLPGGFSYGDYLRAGAIARFSPIMQSVNDFAAAGGPVMGICNGFQILCEAGLLPGALLRNRSVKFQSEDVHIRLEQQDTLFTSDVPVGSVLRIPIAHAEGKYFAEPDTLAALEDQGRVVFRYTNRDGRQTPGSNPNGSANDIAGIRNEAGNVLGMMPHPERAVEPILGSTDGLGIFTSMMKNLAPAGAS